MTYLYRMCRFVLSSLVWRHCRLVPRSNGVLFASVVSIQTSLFPHFCVPRSPSRSSIGPSELFQLPSSLIIFFHVASMQASSLFLCRFPLQPPSNCPRSLVARYVGDQLVEIASLYRRDFTQTCRDLEDKLAALEGCLRMQQHHQTAVGEKSPSLVDVLILLPHQHPALEALCHLFCQRSFSVIFASPGNPATSLSLCRQLAPRIVVATGMDIAELLVFNDSNSLLHVSISGLPAHKKPTLVDFYDSVLQSSTPLSWSDWVSQGFVLMLLCSSFS